MLYHPCPRFSRPKSVLPWKHLMSDLLAIIKEWHSLSFVWHITECTPLEHVYEAGAQSLLANSTCSVFLPWASIEYF